MKLLMKLAVVMIISVSLLGAALIWYVRPSEQMDLRYADLSVEDKIQDMILRRKFELRLREEEVNHILIKELSARRKVADNVEITGARFDLESNRLIAHINFSYRKKIQIGTTSNLQLEWKNPNIVASPMTTKIKDFELPAKWISLQSILVPISDMLPSLVGIKSVSFINDEIRISFKVDMPSLLP